MAMTRKEFLASAASAGALSACAGERFWLPRKDSLRKVKTEEEMYKELFFAVAAGTKMKDRLPKSITFPADFVSDRSFFFTSNPTIEELIFLTDNSSGIARSQFAYTGMTNLHTIKYPNLTSIDIGGYTFDVGTLPAPRNIYIPNVRRFGHPYSLNVRADVRFHIDLTCEGIKDITGFPGNTIVENLKYIHFVGTDGQLDYNESTSQWDFTPNA